MYRDFPFNKGSLLDLFELSRAASTILDVYGFDNKIINLIFFSFQPSTNQSLHYQAPFFTTW